jgi:hypothetical protein
MAGGRLERKSGPENQKMPRHEIGNSKLAEQLAALRELVEALPRDNEKLRESAR